MSSMFAEESSAQDVGPLPRAVVVHGLADALAALAPGVPVTLLSAPGAGSYAGAGWWRALVTMAHAAHPDTPCHDVLDCADAPGHAMAAIRAGQSILVLDPACPAFARVAALATVLATRPPALDLAEHGAARRLRTWLSGLLHDDSTPVLR